MAERTHMTEELEAAEGLLAGGEPAFAAELLSRVASDAEEYISRNCPTTEDVQWFSFPTIFERLCYRRVEKDPRELRDVGEPLDRLYADFALALLGEANYSEAIEALRQAVRWNPMNCAARLDLADLYRHAGDMQEHLALSYSVFERASEAYHLVRAYCNFARYFLESGETQAAAAALVCAQQLDASTELLESLLERTKAAGVDPSTMSFDKASALVAEQGLPEGANAEVALCLVMCASDAAAAQQRALATTLTVRARDLVGSAAVAALIELVHQTDSEKG